jgi:NADPH:quinone reductase
LHSAVAVLRLPISAVRVQVAHEETMTTYKAVMLTQQGGPDVLRIVEQERAPLKAGELRVRVLATGAGGTDVTMRRGSYPYAPPIPFVPGYEAIGEVEEIGEGVSGWALGDRAAALLVHGGYAEELVRPAHQFVHVPRLLDVGPALALILNYVTAYQAIHRTAHVSRGQTVLVNAANGGVGTALVELLVLAGATVYAAAADKHHAMLRAMGAIPIEGRTVDADISLRALLPEGCDVAFDGLNGRFAGQCRRATKRGGRVIGYGFSGSKGTLSTVMGMASLFLGSWLSGKKPSFYGITLLYRRDPTPFCEDLPKLFDLLAAGKLKPKIAARLPLLAARRAAEMLEGGGLEGKIVHLASEGILIGETQAPTSDEAARTSA